MAIYKRDIVDINLETGNIHRSFLNHSIGYLDNAADHFGVRTFRNGTPVDLTGVSVQGIFMPPTGSPIAITSGNIVSGNVAEVVLPQACYNYEGQFTLAIKLVGGGVTGTLRIVDGIVDNTHASGTVAPTSAVPTYQEILSTYDDMVAATAAANGAIAATYSSSSTYAVGDYCIHDGGLYHCTTAITTAEAWTSGHWAAAKLGPDLAALKRENTAEHEAITAAGETLAAQAAKKDAEIARAYGDFDANGYYSTAGSHDYISTGETAENTYSTDPIFIRGYKHVSARGYVSSIAYGIAFLDINEKVIPGISVTAEGSGLESVYAEADLESQSYADAYYVVVTAYEDSAAAQLSYAKVSGGNSQIRRLTELADADMHEFDVMAGETLFGNSGYIAADTGNVNPLDGAYYTDLLPVRPGALIYVVTRLTNISYDYLFYDEDKNIISAISKKNTSSSLLEAGYTIDTSESGYENIAYFRACTYNRSTDGENYGEVHITYPDANENDIPFVETADRAYSLNDEYVIGTTNNLPFKKVSIVIWSTGIVPVSNKTAEMISASTYLDGSVYEVAFLDEYKKIIPGISVKNPGSIVERIHNIDITGSAYDNVRYVVVSTYKYKATGSLVIRHRNAPYPMVGTNSRTCNILKKVVCCGDSYTAGWIKAPSDTEYSATNEGYAWPHYASHITGNNWENCGSSGANVWTWQQAERGLPKAQSLGVSQAYVVGLMINDTTQLQLGTTSDIGTENQTYYGGLSKIVRELAAISPQAFIFLNTCPKNSDTYDAFNQAVRNVVSAYEGTYNVHLIDLAKHSNMFFSPAFAADAINGHYTAIGYEQMAEIYCHMLSMYINSHVSVFQETYKIPYDE